VSGSAEWITRTGDHCRPPIACPSPRRDLLVTLPADQGPLRRVRSPRVDPTRREGLSERVVPDDDESPDQAS
jgi:hypothetical protein